MAASVVVERGGRAWWCTLHRAAYTALLQWRQMARPIPCERRQAGLALEAVHGERQVGREFFGDGSDDPIGQAPGGDALDGLVVRVVAARHLMTARLLPTARAFQLAV